MNADDCPAPVDREDVCGLLGHGPPRSWQRVLRSDPSDAAPAINVQTNHPRYHSFYTFLLDEFWKRERPRSQASWVAFFRPREFVFSLGTHLCDRPEHGNTHSAVGSQTTQGLARRELPLYDTSFNYIKSPLGGYGLPSLSCHDRRRASQIAPATAL